MQMRKKMNNGVVGAPWGEGGCPRRRRVKGIEATGTANSIDNAGPRVYTRVQPPRHWECVGIDLWGGVGKVYNPSSLPFSLAPSLLPSLCFLLSYVRRFWPPNWEVGVRCPRVPRRTPATVKFRSPAAAGHFYSEAARPTQDVRTGLRRRTEGTRKRMGWWRCWAVKTLRLSGNNKEVFVNFGIEVLNEEGRNDRTGMNLNFK